VIVSSLVDATPPIERLEPLVTVRQAARLLGVGRHVLYRAAEAGELAIFDAGGWARLRMSDLERGVIVWPPEECKHGEAHTLPLEGDGLAIVQRLMARPPLHCPYLFHGPRCAPGRMPSKDYACVGSLKYAWRRACRKAGLPVGRAAGGFVFHHTRNTAVTTLTAGGMAEADVMKVTGHQTAHVFKRYDLGNVDALRARLAQARTTAATVTPLRRASDTPEPRVTERPR
jgi:excisionase family DNA binding protein